MYEDYNKAGAAPYYSVDCNLSDVSNIYVYRPTAHSSALSRTKPNRPGVST